MRTSLFSYGFRPHFIAAGIAAAVLIPLWASSYVFGAHFRVAWPPTLWHGHEMLFGFVAAAIAGFLLTAVPNWTGQRGFSGSPLVGLSALWLAGRVAVYWSSVLPAWLVALVDVSFLPVVGLLIAPPLLRTATRNTPLLGILAALAICNGVFHWDVAHENAPAGGHVLLIAIDIVLVLATVIGGRIVPSFSTATLKAQDLAISPSHAIVERLAVGLMIGIVLLDANWPDTPASGTGALIASGVQAIRMIRWQSIRTWRAPIVWVLHLGYAWIPVGLALKGMALLTGMAIAAFWLHALTVGALASLILAVMTRAALGHTGRPLTVAPAIVAAYLLLSAAAIVRVFGLAMLGGSYPLVVLVAAILWTAAFTLFLFVYAPILVAPRVDGNPD